MVISVSRSYCLTNLSPTSYWLTTACFYTFYVGLTFELLACLLEGKPLPTFPKCFCQNRRCVGLAAVRRNARRDAGLQFTPAFGSALQLLVQHGLEERRREDSPVESALESLLSVSPIMVADAQDMDLVSCIDCSPDT